MKRLIFVLLSAILLTACGISDGDSISESSVQYKGTSAVTVTEVNTGKQSELSEIEADHMNIIVGEKAFDVVLEDNKTVDALIEMLPMSLNMSELNGNEKYCYLDSSLPSAPESIGNIKEAMSCCSGITVWSYSIRAFQPRTPIRK